MAESADESGESRETATRADRDAGDDSGEERPPPIQRVVEGAAVEEAAASSGAVTTESDEPSAPNAPSSRDLRVETRIEAIETLYGLWAGENDVKTNKLYVYIVVQSILVTAYAAGADAVEMTVPVVGTTLPLLAVLIPFVGVGTSWMSFVSIGRTVAFQKAWKYKRRDLVESAPEPVRSDFDFYPTDEDKADMPWWGRLGSKYILLAPPVVGLVLWVLVLLGGTLVA